MGSDLLIRLRTKVIGQSWRSWRSTHVMLAGIMLLSLGLRLVSAFYQANVIEALPGVHDQVSYHTLAGRVLEGAGFSFGTDWWPATRAGEPTAHWSYLYTLYMALVYFLFGPNPLVARLIQAAVAAVLHPWLSWRIGRRLFGDQAGLLAALFAAVYGYFVYYAGTLMTESFYILAILWVLDIATGTACPGPGEAAPSRPAWVRLGIAAGAAVLLRQVFLFFTPFLAGWLFYALRGRDPRRRPPVRTLVMGGATMFLVIGLMVLPWTIRNYSAFGRFVLLNTNAGFAFFWGNHPIHGTDFIPILRETDPSYGSLIPRELRHLDEAALDRELLRMGIGFVTQDPARYALLSLSRAKEYFKFWPTPESSRASNVVRTLSFGLFLPLMVLGILAASGPCLGGQSNSGGLRSSPCDGHLLLLIFITVYTLMHLLSWTLVRYRLPVDGILVLYAGAGIHWLANRLSVFGTLGLKRPIG